MANPNDHSVDEVYQPNRTEYGLDEGTTFTGRPGYIYPAYCREAVIGDTINLSPNISLRFAPTVQPLMTRMKVVIDLFAVPLQAIWKNSPFFFNAKQNQIDFMPEMPYLKHDINENYFSTGKLSDYLGVPTTIPGTASVPLVQDFNISFDTADCINHPAQLSYSAGQRFYQYCFLGAYESSREATFTSDPKFADPTDGDDFMERLYSVYGTNVNNQVSAIDYKYYNGRRSDLNVSPYSINESFGLHSLGVSPFLYGSLSRSVFVGAVTQLSNFNSSTIDYHLGGRFRLVNGIHDPLSNPAVESSGLYVVLFQQAKAGSIGTNGGQSNGIPRICAYANQSDVSVNMIQSPNGDGHACEYEVELSSAALANFNDAIDTIKYKYQEKGNFMYGVPYELYIGFFTYYPAGSYTASTQGIFSLPYDANIAEERWNNAHPAFAHIDNTGNSIKGRYFDINSDPNILTEVIGESTLSYSALTNGFDFYNVANVGGLRVHTLQVPTTIDEANDLTNSIYSFDGVNSPKVPLNSLRHRAYECAYNFWYRNKDLNPLLDSNGNRVINQYLTDAQMADGADTFNYQLHKCLLEKDVFTSCLPEPLVNYAPLVGIREKDNKNVILDFAAKDKISSVAIGLETDSDNNPYLKIGAYDNDIPEETMSVLRDCINQGISIHDIHSVESLTRWISNHVEHGYNTTDQQLASFGVKSDWNPLTSPIYLGGTSQLIKNGAVVSQSTDSLGEMAGLLTSFSENENHFKYFCKERCYIIGLMRVVPVPAYTSCIPADMLKFDFTEFYMPEFDRKGWEPVYYKELCPVMSAHSASGSGTEVDDIFGFNVPWHDYKFSCDTLHGDVRRSLNNVVLYREFGEVPVLGNSFTECDPSDYNSIYRSESPLDDKFVANIYWTARWVRPISNPQTRVF